MSLYSVHKNTKVQLTQYKIGMGGYVEIKRYTIKDFMEIIILSKAVKFTTVA